MTLSVRIWPWGGDAAITSAIAVAAPALSFLAPRATVPILLIAVAAQAIILVRRRRRPKLPEIAVSLGFAALIGWASLSMLWSIGPAPRGVLMLLGVVTTGLLCVAWIDRDRTPDALAGMLSAAIVLALLGYMFEGISGASLTRLIHGFAWRDIINSRTGGISVSAYLINGTAILSLFLWPAATSLVRSGHPAHAVGLAALVTIATGYFGSETGLIALAAGSSAWLLAALGRRAAQAGAVAFALAVLATPFALNRLLSAVDLERLMLDHPYIHNSAFVRLFIWKFATDRIAERPLVGWGFDASRRIPGGGDAIAMRTPEGLAALHDIYLPLHPHNQILQVWLELGFVGAAIVAATGALLIWRAGTWAAPARKGALALAATVVIYDVLSFGAWQSWWLAAVFLAAALHSSLMPKSAAG